MNKVVLDNGMKVIYEYRQGNITSFCIGVNGGALEEEGFNYGTAHAVEHMIFKGTEKRTEEDINKCCDEVFGFHNAMTNYPYAIYYGTTHSRDFEKGFEIYSDIILDPVFPQEGFKEEMAVIGEELKEWSEEPAQYCEDLMLSRAFEKRRIRELIIGNEKSIQDISLKELEEFYRKFYCPSNCVVSVVSSLTESQVLSVVEKYFANWHREFSGIKRDAYEKNIGGIFTEEANLPGAKIKYCFPVHILNDREIQVLNIFNSIFGEGVSCTLFDEIRTKRGLAYEVFSEIKQERGIRLFTVYASVSKENVEKTLDIIDNKFEEIKKGEISWTDSTINTAAKRLGLKRELAVEKSIELCKKLTTYELMFGDSGKVFEEYVPLENISFSEIREIANRVFNDPTIFVLK